ncbi:MAG: Hsp20/alpha crystallin family protein [Candidatus Omnitrophica bacterium]|nr:Hsp20/alpha crystallin family protein [Candidatus Omnitrophota bacterium]
MKKAVSCIIFSIVITNLAWAETGPTEQDYQNFDQMRAKLVRMRHEMDKFMKDVIGPYADAGKGGAGIFGQDVRLDVTESDREVTVKADLPGMTKDKINITLEKNKLLKISGSRETFEEKTSQGIVRQERMSGSFERVLELPAECEGKNIKATYKEGVLEIVLQKKKNVKEDTIKVSVQ